MSRSSLSSSSSSSSRHSKNSFRIEYNGTEKTIQLKQSDNFNYIDLVTKLKSIFGLYSTNTDVLITYEKRKKVF